MSDVIAASNQVDLEALAAPSSILVAVGNLHDDPNNLRRAPASREEEEQMRESIRSMGVVQPLLVRPYPGRPGEYIITEGHRRTRHARELGWPQLPAIVRPVGDAEQLAVQAAANMVRAPLRPVDQWAAMVKLTSSGYSTADAGHALGLPERRVRQLLLLGKLHPRLLEEIERHGMPPASHLHRIAAAPTAAQERAVKSADAWESQGAGHPKMLMWHRVAAAVTPTRIPRSRAIFNVAEAGILFEEDLFASPGSDEQWLTSDVKGFLAAQQKVLEEQVAAAKRPKAMLGEWSDSRRQLTIPKGWLAAGYGAKPKGAVMLRGVVTTPGHQLGEISEQLIYPKQKPAQAEAAGHDADGDTPPTAAQTGRGPITQDGRKLLARLQTEALHRALRTRPEDRDAEEWLELLLLALGSSTVSVTGGSVGSWTARRFQDIAAQILDPVGRQRDMDPGQVHRLAAEALSRILVVGSSGPVAQWVGAWIGAKEHLPRLDQPELLATLSADTLRSCAQSAGITPKGTASALRAALDGKAPQLWIEEAEFGALGPPECELETAEDSTDGA